MSLRDVLFKKMEQLEVVSLRRQVAELKSAVSRLSDIADQILRISTESRSLVGPFGVLMPNDAMLVQTIHGLKYLIDPNDLVMAPQLIIYRQWEPELTALFRQNLVSSSVMVDVGANFGYFTCLAANAIGTGGEGRVFAFEPNPRLVPLLRDNCRINWSIAPVHVFDCAVGASVGTATISVPRDGAANATLTELGDGCEKHEISVVSLDDTLPDDLVVDWMKIDVEGHEKGVLQGARKTIDRSPGIRIVMEWSVGQMYDAGTPPCDVIKTIEELGLVAASVPGSGLLNDVKRLDLGTLAEIAYDNIILWRP